MNSFGKRLRTLRLEKGLNGIELGKMFNFSKSTISSWENETREPSHEILKILANYFEVSLDYLLGISDNRINEPVVDSNDKKDIHGFTVSLVNRLLEEGIIKDKDDIDQNIIDAIKSALLLDAKKKH